MNWVVRIGIFFVRAYQVVLGPFLGGACRFEPSCSNYAIDAMREHGFLRGCVLTLRRLAHCHPFARPGFDPVPPRHERIVRS